MEEVHIKTDETEDGFFSTTGTLDDAIFEILIKKDLKWNGKVVFALHGFRGYELELTPDLRKYYWTSLFEEGWMIAATSYRRNGPIVKENLYNYFVKTFGEPKVVRYLILKFEAILCGDSMGGLIATVIAEQWPEFTSSKKQYFHGVVAVGAALSMVVNETLKLTKDPKLPIIFLTNISELDDPVDYVKQTRNATTPPNLWKINRNGHCKVNEKERTGAILAVEKWSDKTFTPENDIFATIDVKIEKSGAFLRNDGGLDVKIRSIDVHGSLIVDLIGSDLANLGIKIGDRFTVESEKNELSLKYGTDYSSVPEGRCVAFESAEGWLKFVCNRGDLAARLKIEKSDLLVVKPSND